MSKILYTYCGESGVVKSNGVIIELRGKEGVLFSVLHSANGTLIKKDQLMELIWPNNSAVMDLSSLTQLMSKLRKTLKPIGLDANIISTTSEYGLQRYQPKPKRYGMLTAIGLIVGIIAVGGIYYQKKSVSQPIVRTIKLSNKIIYVIGQTKKELSDVTALIAQANIDERIVYYSEFNNTPVMTVIKNGSPFNIYL